MTQYPIQERETMPSLRQNAYLGSVKGGSDLGGTKGKTHVSRVGGSNGVHGKTTSLVSSSGESGHLVRLDGSAHPENIARLLKEIEREREDAKVRGIHDLKLQHGSIAWLDT